MGNLPSGQKLFDHPSIRKRFFRPLMIILFFVFFLLGFTFGSNYQRKLDLAVLTRTDKQSTTASIVEITDLSKMVTLTPSPFSAMPPRLTIQDAKFIEHCQIDIILSSGELSIINIPDVVGKSCSLVMGPVISPDKKTAAFQLHLTTKEKLTGNIGSENSLFVYFADERGWLKIFSFGGEQIHRLNYYSPNLLLFDTKSGENVSHWQVSLYNLKTFFSENCFEKVVDLNAHEISYSGNLPVGNIVQTIGSLTEKIYNEEYSFQLNYPLGWQVETKDLQSSSWNIFKKAYATEPLNFIWLMYDRLLEINITDPQQFEKRDFIGVENSLHLMISRIKNNFKTNQPIKNLDDFEKLMKTYYKEGRVIQKKYLSGKEAIFSRKNTEAIDEHTLYWAESSGYDKEVDIFYNNLVYTLTCNGEWYQSYCDNFFSSFKFVE